MTLSRLTRTLAFLAIAPGSVFLPSCAPVPVKKSDRRVEQPQFNQAVQAIAQNVRTRKMKPWTANQVWKKPGGDLVPSGLVQIQPGGDGSVYGLDRQSGCIVRLSPAKVEQVCMNEDRSRLPLPISNFQLAEDGTLLAAASHRLWRRRPNGAIEEIRKTADVGYFALDGNRVVYENPVAPAGESGFRWIDLDGASETHASKVPPLLRNEKDHHFAILGKVAADRQLHRIYHVSERCGLLLGIGDQGGVTLDFARTTIDAAPLPKLEILNIRETTVTRFAFGQSMSATAIAADNGRVWVVGVMPTGAKTYKHVLDVYDGEHGDYLESYNLPMEPSGIAVRGRQLYFSVGFGVEAWDLPTAAVTAFAPTAH